MFSWRKPLAAVALIVALVALVNYYLFAVDRATGQIIWNIIDPVIIVVLAALIPLNIADSVRARRRAADGGGHGHGGHQLPRDIITAGAAVTTMFYLHNYLLKVAFGTAAANPWIWHFIVPPVVALLAVEGIGQWLRAGREG